MDIKVEFKKAFQETYDGLMLITAYYMIKYNPLTDTYYFHVASYADEDGPGFCGDCEITYSLALQIYKEIK